MKIALVHDYIRDFGGAERVLKVLSDLYPEAPIYTAFMVQNSTAAKEFKDKKILESKLAALIRNYNLYSPLRFLLPFIWGSVDLSNYDLVITSSSNYIARGFKTSPNTEVICYCHTPPRFLYGFKTGDLQKMFLVKIYAKLITPFIKNFDKKSAQKINYWIANSKNVKERIKKFYDKDATVIYPPINVEEIIKASKNIKKEDFYLIVARLVGTKGLKESIKAAKEVGFNLKVVGESSGILDISRDLKNSAADNVEFLGRVPDKELWELYAKAKGFLAFAKDEDFGMTVVEAESTGTPVIAFNGGGFKESIVDGKTGILVDDLSLETMKKVFEKFENTKWNKRAIQENALKFSKDRFKKEFKDYILSHAGTSRS